MHRYSDGSAARQPARFHAPNAAHRASHRARAWASLGAIVLAGAVLLACGGDDSTPEPTTAATSAATPEPTSAATPATTAATSAPTSAPTTATTATATEAATAAPGGEERQAPIGNFVLPSLTVSTGTTVVWSNQDGVPHTATADDGEFNSGTLSEGDRYEHTFDTAGTFAYFCEVHPTMTGEITVE